MPIKASAVGAEYKPRDLILTKRDLLSFAAGLGIDWPIAMDDMREGGIVGFPTYCASLEFNTFGASAAEGINPVGYTEEESHRGVHVGQDTVFHAPLKPGDRLRTEGQVVSAQTSSAGAVLVVRAETRSLISGAPICTSWITQLYRGLPLVGEPVALASPPAAPMLTEGDLRHRLDVPVSLMLPHVYAECSDIWNPIHSEREVARGAGLKDIILQGTATWSFAAREVVELFCDRDPRRLKRLTTRFAGMAHPGDTLGIEIFTPGEGVVPFRVVNQDGAPVLKNGLAHFT